MPVVFLVTEQGWGNLAAGGEGGSHWCQEKAGKRDRTVVLEAVRLLWQLMAWHRPGIAEYHGYMHGIPAEMHQRPEGKTPGISPPQAQPSCQAPSRDSSQNADAATYLLPGFKVAALQHWALSSLAESRLSRVWSQMELLLIKHL